MIDGLEPPADLRDRRPPSGRPEVDRRVVDQGRGRAELAHGEVPPDDLGADDARPVAIEVGELVVIRLGPGPDHRQRAAAPPRRPPGSPPGTGRSGRRHAPRIPSWGHRQAPWPSRSPPAGRMLRNGQKIAPRSRASSAGASVKEAASATARLSAMAGPGVLDLGEAGEEEHPQPDDHRPGRGDQRTADLVDRLAQGVGPRPAAPQLLGIPRDQEQAVVGPRSEEHDHHEDLRDVDDLEPEPGHRGQAGRSPGARPAPTARS